MPRYFFNLDDGTNRPDTVGLDLSGIGEARRHARTIASEITSRGSASKVIEVVITDHRDKTIARIPGLG